MRRFSVAVLVAALAAAVVLAGCGGGGGGGSAITNPDEPTNPPLNPTNVVLTGTVRDQNLNPVQNVTITMGELPLGPITAKTNANGNFSLALPSGKTPMDLFPSANFTFQVDVSSAGANYVRGAWVGYYGVNYPPDAVSLWDSTDARQVLFSQTTNMGVISVTYYDPNSGGPPPAPF